jgi:5-methylcytosine-specific restriction endonuclease McrA
MLILAVNAAGLPNRWLSIEEAATYKAKDLVFEIGEPAIFLRGGVNARTGERSGMPISSIIVVKGPAKRVGHLPGPKRSALFRRDRCLCAYCGEPFADSVLTMDHIVPAAQGGASTWTNLVTACARCNGRKGNRTPATAGMPLLYLPYVPGRNEAFILQNRRVLADQMAFLLAGVPATSRLHS